MAFIREELDETLKQLQERQSESKLRQARVKQQVGQQMSELLNDPKWRIFNDHIEALKEPHAGKVTQIEQLLSKVQYFSSPEEFNKIQFDLCQNRTALRTYEGVQRLILALIEDGQKANKDLELQS